MTVDAGASALAPPARDLSWYLRALQELLASDEWDVIHDALRDVMAHLVEASILGHRELGYVREMPAVYGPRADEELRSFFGHHRMSEALSADDIAVLARAITRANEPEEVSPAAVYDLLKAAAAAPSCRCSMCGYRFTADDFSHEKRQILANLQVDFAPSIGALRRFDYYKPHSATGAHIDHRIPRASWGGSGPSNLQLLCEFCNLGKLAFRYPLEGISHFSSLSLRLAVRGPGEAVGRHHWPALVAAIAKRAACGTCGATAGSTELRAGPSESDVWAGPWNLQVSCYDCHGTVGE